MKNLILILTITTLSLSCTRGRDTYYLPEIKVLTPPTKANPATPQTNAPSQGGSKTEPVQTSEIGSKPTENNPNQPVTVVVNSPTEPTTETVIDPATNKNVEVVQPLPSLPLKPVVNPERPVTIKPVTPSTENRKYKIYVFSSNFLKANANSEVSTNEIIVLSKDDEDKKITVYKDDKRELYINSDRGILSYHTVDLVNDVELAPESSFDSAVLGSAEQKDITVYYAKDELYSNLLTVIDVSSASSDDLRQYVELDTERTKLKEKRAEIAKRIQSTDKDNSLVAFDIAIKKIEAEIHDLCRIIVALGQNTNY